MLLHLHCRKYEVVCSAMNFIVTITRMMWNDIHMKRWKWSEWKCQKAQSPALLSFFWVFESSQCSYDFSPSIQEVVFFRSHRKRCVRTTTCAKQFHGFTVSFFGSNLVKLFWEVVQNLWFYLICTWILFNTIRTDSHNAIVAFHEESRDIIKLPLFFYPL